MEGWYGPVAIKRPEDDVLQRYSEALGLHFRWERGHLEWRDTVIGQPIASLEAAGRQVQELQGNYAGSAANNVLRHAFPFPHY